MPEGLKTSGDLWCMHVEGPDDLHAAPDFWTALAWAAELNTFVAEKAIKGGWATDDNWPLTQATVRRWIGTPESHAVHLSIELADRAEHKAKRKDAALAAQATKGGGETDDLDARLKAAGMFTVPEMLGKTPLSRWTGHVGVRDLASFEQWLDRRTEEFLRMRVGYELGDKPKDDELYEWTLAHSAALSAVREHFKAAIAAAPSPPTAPALASDGRVGEPASVDAWEVAEERKRADLFVAKLNEAEGYAMRLAQSLSDKHYPNPDWRPLPDLYGVLTQIDNMTTGLARSEAPAAPVGDLAGLSDRATPGPWEVSGQRMGGDWLVTAPDRVVACCRPWSMRVGDERNEHDAAFIVALVNAYRSGRLVEAPAALLPAAHRETVTEEEIGKAHAEAVRHADWWKLSEEQWRQIRQEYVPALLKVLSAPRAEGETQDGWQPIETAPKDGTHILIARPSRFEEDHQHVVRWDDDSAIGPWWVVHDGKSDHPLRGPNPTHWRFSASPDAVQTNGGER